MNRSLARKAVCALCGHPNTLAVDLPSRIPAPSQLDLRPAPAPGWMPMGGVETCEGCGYCAPNLERVLAGAATVVTDPAYLALIQDREIPGSTYQRLAMVAEAAGEAQLAGLAWRAAAWSADDAQAPDLARTCRRAAAQHLADCKTFEWAGHDRVVAQLSLADLWRRAGAWDKARLAAARGLSFVGDDEDLTRALTFEAERAARRDDRAYRFADAGGTGHSQDPSPRDEGSLF